MNITSAKYIAHFDGVSLGENFSIEIVVDGQKCGVPLDPANRHYAEIMRQVEAGELTIQDADD